MKYVKAKDILPEGLLKKVQKYAAGQLLYIPADAGRKAWGERNGTRAEYDARNRTIRIRLAEGTTAEELADSFFLTPETILKIAYEKENHMRVEGFPEYMYEYKITPIPGPVPEYDPKQYIGRRHPQKVGDGSITVRYGYPDRTILSKTVSRVIEEVSINCIKAFRTEWTMDDKSGQHITIVTICEKDGPYRYLGSEYVRDGVREITVNRDCFPERDEDEEEQEEPQTHSAPSGGIMRDGDRVVFSEKAERHDAVGRYRVEMNGQTWDTVLFMSGGGSQSKTVTEDYRDAEGNTVLYRTFEPADAKTAPDTERLNVNGEEYALATDHLEKPLSE